MMRMIYGMEIAMQIIIPNTRAGQSNRQTKGGGENLLFFFFF
jgi:hypothetical protein